MYVAAARHAHARQLGVNAGHDLDLDNLVLFRTLPYLAEVSIGHALISRAIFVGLERLGARVPRSVLAGDPRCMMRCLVTIACAIAARSRRVASACGNGRYVP